MEFVIEVACNKMLGNFNSDEPWGAIVNMEKQFIFQKCEINLIDHKMQ